MAAGIAVLGISLETAQMASATAATVSAVCGAGLSLIEWWNRSSLVKAQAELEAMDAESRLWYEQVKAKQDAIQVEIEAIENCLKKEGYKEAKHVYLRFFEKIDNLRDFLKIKLDDLHKQEQALWGVEADASKKITRSKKRLELLRIQERLDSSNNLKILYEQLCGLNYFYMRNYEKALIYFNRATKSLLSLPSRDEDKLRKVMFLNQRARTYYELSEKETNDILRRKYLLKARRDLNESVHDQPDQNIAQALLCFIRNDFEKALERINIVLELKDRSISEIETLGDVDPLRLRAKILMAQGNYVDAKETLNQAIHIIKSFFNDHPDSVILSHDIQHLYILRGNVFQALKQEINARNDFKQTCLINPRNRLALGVLAEAGDARAQAYLGYSYIEKYLNAPLVEAGVRVQLATAELEEAFKWLTSSADLNDALGKDWLSDLYTHGLGVKKDLARAKALLEEAVALGSARAACKLAEHYQREEKYGKALKLLQDAAKEELPEARYKLGMMYHSLPEDKRNKDEGIYWLKLAAEESYGCSMAQYQLGILYDEGCDLFVMSARGALSKGYKHCYILEPMISDFTSCFMRGSIPGFIPGTGPLGGSSDFKEEVGSIGIGSSLWFINKMGVIVKVTVDDMVKFLSALEKIQKESMDDKKLRLESAWCQQNITLNGGHTYCYVKQGLRKARKFYKMAAKQGHPKALYQYGLGFLNGWNGTDNIDLAKAIALFKAAEKLGVAEAKQQLIELRKKYAEEKSRWESICAQKSSPVKRKVAAGVGQAFAGSTSGAIPFASFAQFFANVAFTAAVDGPTTAAASVAGILFSPFLKNFGIPSIVMNDFWSLAEIKNKLSKLINPDDILAYDVPFRFPPINVKATEFPLEIELDPDFCEKSKKLLDKGYSFVVKRTTKNKVVVNCTTVSPEEDRECVDEALTEMKNHFEASLPREAIPTGEDRTFTIQTPSLHMVTAVFTALRGLKPAESKGATIDEDGNNFECRIS